MMCSGSVCVGSQGCRSENGTSSGGTETESGCSGDLNADESETWKGPKTDSEKRKSKFISVRLSRKKSLHDIQLMFELTWTWSGIGIWIQNVWMLGKGWESQTCSPPWAGEDCPAPIWMESGIPNVTAMGYNIYNLNVHKASKLTQLTPH